MAADVVVVGGGIVGLSAAYYLAGEGARVTLVERQRPGAGATGASAGMLAAQLEPSGPGPLFDMALRARDLYGSLAADLLAETGVDIGLVRGGILALAPAGPEPAGDPDGEAARLRDAVRWQNEAGAAAAWWEPAQVEAYVPGVQRCLGGLYAERDAFLVPEHAAFALAAACRRRGVEVLNGVQVTGFLRDGARVTGVRTDAGDRAAGEVVLAAGAWSGSLAALLDLHVPVLPVRGQILVLDPEPDRAGGDWRSRGTPVYSDHSYLVPRRDGRVLVGATVEPGEWRAEPTAAGLAHLAGVVRRIVPALEAAAVIGWRVGLRPGTPDGLPVIGRPEGRPGLVLATGHFRNGILLGPLTGRLVAALCAGRRPEIDLTPFSPDRFG
ncbi:glycine oxidase ThiO [Caldinitratiruptor microaerophilus]|uniref:glycine oxidase n=1 Tax=Caldinitratiruptor microaerophilus TaxID=671077 RepID=A0AA35CK96_9FIRM|nr:glycine oxidase ThiO [Caldinitratiruptor microaerophilus]BDG60767.1 glycine oxidase [Caldinitratiruptor microaerophilus]